MNPARTYLAPRFPVCGTGAPQPSPTGFSTRAAAHSSLAFGCAVGILIAAIVIILSSAASVALRPSAALRGSKPPYVVQPEAVCNLVSMECVMRSRMSLTSTMSALRSVSAMERERGKPFDFGNNSFAPQLELPAPIALLAKPKLPAISDLTFGQQMAMLSMSGRHNLRNQAIYRALREEESVPPFTLVSFVELKDMGLAARNDGQRWHHLTSSGIQVCDDVATFLQRERNLHAPYLMGAVKASVTLKCTCLWSCSIRRGEHVQANAMRAFSTHMRTVEAMGDLKTALVPRGRGV